MATVSASRYVGDQHFLKRRFTLNRASYLRTHTAKKNRIKPRGMVRHRPGESL
jgi:hypothetical protein